MKAKEILELAKKDFTEELDILAGSLLMILTECFQEIAKSKKVTEYLIKSVLDTGKKKWKALIRLAGYSESYNEIFESSIQKEFPDIWAIWVLARIEVQESKLEK